MYTLIVRPAGLVPREKMLLPISCWYLDVTIQFMKKSRSMATLQVRFRYLLLVNNYQPRSAGPSQCRSRQAK
jgi:hypothetical protein